MSAVCVCTSTCDVVPMFLLKQRKIKYISLYYILLWLSLPTNYMYLRYDLLDL